MAKFDKIHTGELEDWLFHSYVHDSEIMKIESNCDTGDLRVILFNPIFRVRTELSFHDVEVVFAKKGEWPGSRRTVISLSVQENSQYLQKAPQIHTEYSADALALLFEMLSGDKLLIIAKEVTIETAISAEG